MNSDYCTDKYTILFSSFTVIEHLPQELRDRFTDMREMDLGVQSKSI